MSWESTLDYYRIINEQIHNKLGLLHSGKILLYSFDFQEIEVLQHAQKWDQLTVELSEQAERLEKGGADFLLICTNTMHIMADKIQERIQIPILNIIDVTAETVKGKKIRKVGLLGTSFTMEKDFYKGRLSGRHHLEVLVPEEDDRETVHRIIYDELCKGLITEESRSMLVGIIEKLIGQKCEGIILGCTELPMIIKQEDVEVPVFDTTTLHAIAAADQALA